MPKRSDIRKILIIGSGPVNIGQASESDYSGVQACKALKELGYEIVLVNSNHATITTDDNVADVTYIEPLNIKRLTDIIANERPDALLPNIGGQTSLNLCLELNNAGILDKYKVDVIGTQIDTYETLQDRIALKNSISVLGLDMPLSSEVSSVDEAESMAIVIGYPVVIRPAFSVDGTGGGIAYNVEELKVLVERGIESSLISQIVLEESMIEWSKAEYEVLRDSNNSKLVICQIENVDPMGIHSGDSICVTPMITVSQQLQNTMKEYSYSIVEHFHVIGNAHIQYAFNPTSQKVVVLDVKLGAFGSSEFATKAAGISADFVATKLAMGLNLDELEICQSSNNHVNGHVVVKFPRWIFEKFTGVEDRLGTQMRSIGEVMGVGKSYKEALQKAVRSLDTGRHGLGFAKDFHSLDQIDLKQLLIEATSERQFIIYEALRKGVSVEDIHVLTHINTWFIAQMKNLIDLENQILQYRGQDLPVEMLRNAKIAGFSDLYLAGLLDVSEESLRVQRLNAGMHVQLHAIKGCSQNLWCYYSSYRTTSESGGVDATSKGEQNMKVIVLGGGPNRIGHGNEFDYCCVHALQSLKELGFETIMVNCNPRAVSTNFDTADILYLEAITLEDVLAIYEYEKPLGVIAQFAGQMPMKIANGLQNAGVKILGTSPETFALAENKTLFQKFMSELNIPMPESGTACDFENAKQIANKIKYPLLVSTPTVFGGKSMEVVHDEESLRQCVEASDLICLERPIIIDRFLENALECEADVLCDGENAFIPVVMEHIEYAGIHSGDSACVIPPFSITEEQMVSIKDYSCRIASKLGVIGLMNVQFAIENGKVFVLEAKPRAARTVPLVSKVCDINLVHLTVKIIMSKFILNKLDLSSLQVPEINHFGVKEAVFPFKMFTDIDPILGPQMHSTGSVLGLAETFGLAFYKALEGSGTVLPLSGTVLLSVNEEDREASVAVAKYFEKLGFQIKATRGTFAYISARGVKAEIINKLHEGRPNIEDAIKNGMLNMVINTPTGKRSSNDDSYIRKAAIKFAIPYITTLTAALASAKGIEDRLLLNIDNTQSLQKYKESV